MHEPGINDQQAETRLVTSLLWTNVVIGGLVKFVARSYLFHRAERIPTLVSRYVQLRTATNNE